MSERRTVGDEDVHLGRHPVVDGRELLSRLPVERQVHEGRRPRASVEMDTVDDHRRVLEVDHVRRHQRASPLHLSLEGEIVVAGDEDLRLVRERGEPRHREGHLRQAPVPAEVAGVHEHVPGGDLEITLTEMSVGEGDDAHGRPTRNTRARGWRYFRLPARHADDGAAETLGAVVRAETAGEETVAVGDVHLVAETRAGGEEGARHQVRPGVDVTRGDAGGLDRVESC